MSDLFLSQVWISLLLPESRGEDSLEGQMNQGDLFKWFKMGFCELVKRQGKVARRCASVTLRSVSMETIQKTSETFIFADIYG